MINNYYDLFEISQNASEEEIKAAYRRLVKKYHPDKSSLPNANEIFHEIQTAYEILNNPYSRAIYDNVLNTKQNQESHYTATQTKKTNPVNKPKQRKKAHLRKHFRFYLVLLVSLAGFLYHQFYYAYRWTEIEAIYSHHYPVQDRKIHGEGVQYFIKIYYKYDIGSREFLARKEIYDKNIIVVKRTEIPEKISLHYDSFKPTNYRFGKIDNKYNSLLSIFFGILSLLSITVILLKK